MSEHRTIQVVKTASPGRARRLVPGGLALAAALLMATWLPQAASTAQAFPRLASTPPAATTTTTSPLRAPHRQWLNLAYATVSGAQKLDLYMPVLRSAAARAPGLVVYVHGGAWLPGQGDKANYISLTFVNFFLSLGYSAASVDYRLSNEARFPAQIEDVKTAVRWVRAHAAQYGYDPNEVAAMGDSAGGQLVALLGTSESAPSIEGSFLGNPRISSSIKATIGPGW